MFLTIGLVWLGVIAKKFYQKYLGSFFSERGRCRFHRKSLKISQITLC
ncbi:MAG: hypothetical protein JSW12_16895 [Deltaproteobacteria bacterium]|nr:MAG: hypothetical protein JSW12_16895 [Deltaproteobacteria bacterium]